MILTLRAMNPSVSISNSESEIIHIKEEKKSKNFLIELEKEVKQNPRKAKKLRILLTSTYSVCVSSLVLTNPVFAASPTVSAVDPDLMSTLLIIMVACVGLSMVAAIIAFMLAGTWKMFFGGKQADEWTINIVKGIAQVLAAPVVVALIAGIFTLMFSQLPAFQPIIAPLSAWFQK